MKHIQRILALCILAFVPAFGQTEALQPSQSAQASIGKARPGVEAIGASRSSLLDGAEKYAQGIAKTVDQSVLAGYLDQQETAKYVQALSDIDPGHNWLNVTARHADGTPFYSYTTHNLRTNAGANWQADIMANTTTPSVNAQCNYIALTNDATAPGASDTTLTSEIAANGLSRAQGTYAHTLNATSFTVSKTFTATGTQSFQKAGMFTASSSGTMCFETAVTSGTVNNTDTLTFTWTVNF